MNAGNAFTFNDIDITAHQGVLKLPIYIRGLHLTHPGNHGNPLPVLHLQLKDVNNNSTLQTVKTYRTDIIGSGDKFELVDTVEVNLAEITASGIYIKGKLFLQKNPRNVRIAEVYDLRDESNPEQTVAENSVDETAVLGKTSDKLPTEFKLNQNFPNPFNPETQISFELPAASFVKLKIFDVNGRLVNNLIYRHMEAGRYTVTWNGANSNGQPVSSGTYLYRLVAEKFAVTKKMTLLR